MKTARELVEAANSDTSLHRNHQALLRTRAARSLMPMVEALERVQKLFDNGLIGNKGCTKKPCSDSCEHIDECAVIAASEDDIATSLRIANGEEQP